MSTTDLDPLEKASTETALEAAKEAGADEAEVSYLCLEEEFLRFTDSEINEAGTSCTITARIRVLLQGHLGEARVSMVSPEAIRASVRDAVAAAQQAPKLQHPQAFASAAATTSFSVSGPPSKLRLNAEVEQITSLFDENRDEGVLFAGNFTSHHRRYAVTTGAGARLRASTNRAGIQLLANTGNHSGHAQALTASDTQLPYKALGDIATDRARRSKHSRSLIADHYDVVLAPEAVAGLLDWLSHTSFGAQHVLDGTSPLSDDATLCDKSVSVEDRSDPYDVPFDSEGSIRQTVTLLREGHPGSPLTDRNCGALLSVPSTGHAPDLDCTRSNGPTFAHLHLAPGDATEQDLISEVDRGIYVSRLRGISPLLDRSRATMTGFTRQGTFLIEDGCLGAAVQDLGFTQSIWEAFSKVGGIGSQVRDVPSTIYPGAIISAPAVLLRRFHFSR